MGRFEDKVLRVLSCLWLLVALFITGCALGTSPQPEGTADDAYFDAGEDIDGDGIPDGVADDPGARTALETTYYAPSEAAGMYLLAALPGTVWYPAFVQILNPRLGIQEEVEVNPAGGFVGHIAADVGDVLQLGLVVDDLLVAQTSLPIVGLSAGEAAAGQDLDDAFEPGAVAPASTLSVIDVDRVAASGDPGSLSPGFAVILTNPSRGLTEAGQVAADGSYFVEIDAASGEELELFAVDLAGGQSGSPTLVLLVP